MSVTFQLQQENRGKTIGNPCWMSLFDKDVAIHESWWHWEKRFIHAM